MLEDIKKELINNPDKLIQVLEHYDYCNIVNHGKYISFGRDETSSKKSIVIRLEKNDFIWVTDYARNISQDIFSYIMSQRKVQFIEVLNVVKSTLGITDYYEHFERRKVFGGFYDRIRKKGCNKAIRVYDESVLDEYSKLGNVRFLKDHISIPTQCKFHIGYDIESQGITIPIYDQLGQLMGVKCRKNYEDDDMKYFYLLPCRMSETLYGFAQNYSSLINNTIFVYESEKACMQCDSYGINNTVSLGSGTISNQQIKMLMECHPKNIIFMHDNKYEIDSIMGNINKVIGYSRFNDIGIGYWDWTNSLYSGYGKISPSDLGKDNLEYIMNNEIKMVRGDLYEEEI